jgi:hypothetical protein
MRIKVVGRRKMRVLILLFGLAMSIPAAFAQEGATPAEQSLFQLANQHRGERGLTPLAWDASLARAARAHAQRMSRETGEPQHQYAGEPDVPARAAQAGAHFSKTSENIAAAKAPLAEVERSWMDSPVHRANILDPQLNAVGIGVVEAQGVIYAVEDFARASPALSRDEIEARAQQALQGRGLKVETSDAAKQAARKSCESTSGPPPAGVLAVMQFDCTDLNEFPDIVLKGIPHVKEHVVAVGSCGSAQSREGFTTYHLTVLMYPEGH